MSKIAKNIKQFRAENKMTQDLLAEKINVTRQTVSSWETGRTQPDIEMLELLSSALGVSAEELIYGKKNRVGLDPEKKTDRKIYTVVLAVFGTLLTVAGIAVLFIEFWSALKFAKNIFAMLPLAAGFALALFAVTKKKNSVAWREGSAVAWTVGVAVTNALINSLNGIHVGFGPLLLVDTVLIIPVMFITRGIFPFAAFYYGLSHAAFALLPESFSNSASAVFILVPAAFLFAVGVLFYVKRKAGDVTDVIRFWIIFVALGADFVLTSLFFFDFGYMQDDFSVGLIYAFMLAAYFIGDRFSPRPLRQLSAFALLVLSVCLIVFGDGYHGQFPLTAFYAVPAACVVISAVFAFIDRRKIAADKLRPAFSVVSVLALAVFLFTAKSADSGSLAKALFSFALSAIFIIRGVSDGKLLTVNAGLLSGIAAIIILFLRSEADIVVKGVAVLVSGIAVLVINRILLKKFSASDKPEETENA